MPQERKGTDESELATWFADTRRVIETAYLASDDPIVQSGFGGGPERWRREREAILAAVTADGDFLDACCANGHLLECLVAWARERGVLLVPFGSDYSERLIELARARLPAHGSNFWVANAWDWRPPRTFRYVYVLLDCVPTDKMPELAKRLLARAVSPGGRLIAGHYGSRSRGEPPLPVPQILRSAGLTVAGESSGGEPTLTRFAWVDKP
ncbi:MAG TPA: class I SAM-dependent methyltransferase [Thermoplasmata archaeon]|nr:class I SAM-dependent methyltransferase [Thermoplasmata archaeon]